MCKRMNTPVQTRPTKSDWRVETALAVANASFRDHSITLLGISRQMRVSPRYLGRLFNREVGITYHRYLLTLRMLEGATLLRTAETSIKEIALDLGYHDTALFCNDFRKYFEMRPGEWRLRERSAPMSDAKADLGQLDGRVFE